MILQLFISILVMNLAQFKVLSKITACNCQVYLQYMSCCYSSLHTRKKEEKEETALGCILTCQDLPIELHPWKRLLKIHSRAPHQRFSMSDSVCLRWAPGI